MKVNYNSILAKLFRHFYGLDETEEMPSNLYVYTISIILALLLIIPLEIINLPLNIILYLFKRKWYNVLTIGMKFSITLFSIFIGYFTWFFLTPLITLFHPLPNTLVKEAIITDIVIGSLALIIIVFKNKTIANILKRIVSSDIDWENVE